MSSWGILEWQALASIVSMVGVIVLAIAMLYLRASFASKHDMAAVSGMVERIDGRLAMVEHDQKSAPGAAVIAELRDDFGTMKGEHGITREMIASVREILEGQTRALTRIEDRMMRRIQ